MGPPIESVVVELEETPVDIPLTILPATVSMDDEQHAKPTDRPDVSSVEEPQVISSPDTSSFTGDVFASSGKAASQSPGTMAKILPISPLALPDDTKKLPFTLSDVFFDYDQYSLQENDLNALATNAQVLLARYPKKKVLIEGHCDERGTEEYNLALGIRRAQAVKEYLVDLGVPAEKMQVLSYGKERPFCTQHSWNCWKHNRRSHFVFQ
ncbi:MAG: peptidoglycan-associated lipoprotein Pal [Nitrospirales bacterium]|nr:peptidoglycan-associated lipoprotein Pal [Nitrospirales bacterium]